MKRLLHNARVIIKKIEKIPEHPDINEYLDRVLYRLDYIISRTENMRNRTHRSAKKQEARKITALLLNDSITDYFFSFRINDKVAKMVEKKRLENPIPEFRFLTGREAYVENELSMTHRQHMKRLLHSARVIIKEIERIPEHPNRNEYLNQVLYWLDCIIHRAEGKPMTDPFGRKQKAQKTAAIALKHLIIRLN